MPERIKNRNRFYWVDGAIGKTNTGGRWCDLIGSRGVAAGVIG